MLKFTPGPWVPREDDPTEIHHEGRPVTTAWASNAYGILISKAPEMYAILEAIAQGDYVSRESVQEFLGSFND